MKYYVTYSEYYPIYEAAEGGYYYSGKQKVEEHCFSTFKKAKRKFMKWFRETDLEMDANYFEGNSYKSFSPHNMFFGVNGRYIGDGYIVELTRKPVKERGYEPYC